MNNSSHSVHRVRTKRKIVWCLQSEVLSESLRPFYSKEFSFPTCKYAVWKFLLTYDRNSSIKFQLILVDTAAPISSEISGTICVHDEKCSFGPKIFGCHGEELSIIVQIPYRQREDIELDIEIAAMQNFKTPEVLANDLSKMFLAKTLSDVILEVDEEDIPAHKVILSARSSVFMAMFQSGMQEEHNSRVKITDVPVEVVKELLRYTYTGVVEKMDSLGPELMIAADKYNMIDLKGRCRQWLLANLSVETAAKVLLLADSLSDEILMKEMIPFTVENLPKVIESSGWSSLTSQRPILMEDLLKAMSRMKVTL